MPPSRDSAAFYLTFTLFPHTIPGLSIQIATHTPGGDRLRNPSMTIATNLGFPRMGVRRELNGPSRDFGKAASNWRNCSLSPPRPPRHWQLQRDAGIEHVPCGDFSLYDHVLDTAAMVGAIPRRFRSGAKAIDLPLYFALARGTQDCRPLDMTKWFDTNYHYLMPEFEPQTAFRLSFDRRDRRLCRGQGIGHPRPAGAPRPGILSPAGQEQGGRRRAAGVCSTACCRSMRK